MDNSPTNELKYIFEDVQDVKYIFSKKNLGFGKGHNVALSLPISSSYHLILNPDVYFQPQVISELISYMEQKTEVGLVQPKVLFPNGDIQYLCKRYPSLFIFFARRFLPKYLQHFFIKKLNHYEMRDLDMIEPSEVLLLSGCFMLFRKKYLDEIGYFDDNYFMYCEDFDLSIRMNECYKNVFYPNVFIYHSWERGAHKSWKLSITFMRSIVLFFNKHGWKIY